VIKVLVYSERLPLVKSETLPLVANDALATTIDGA